MFQTSQIEGAHRVPNHSLQALSPASQRIVTRLLDHEPESSDLSVYPTSRFSSVLILLYEKDGHIKVLLTTRSKHLRSYPGQTALPGGKYDKSDSNVIDTAYREAYEEVALPRHCPAIHTLCVLRTFILHKLLVIPVVALLTNVALLDSLSPSVTEVDEIFDHPLEAFLDPSLSATTQTLVPKGSKHWPYETDFHNTCDIEVSWLNDTAYRMHCFRSTASPIEGLTSDILTSTAEIAYGRATVYERHAPGELDTFAAMALILEEHGWTEKTQVSADPLVEKAARRNGTAVIS